MISISKKIRSVCKRRMLISTLFILLMSTVLVYCPFLNIFHPTVIHDIYNVKQTDSYVNVTADTLYYSGYNLIKTGSTDYGYYYGLKNEKCVFVIIPIKGTPKAIINDYQFKAKLIKPDKSYRQMISGLSKDLNWNEDALSSIAGNFILSNADYHPYIYMILLWIVLIILLIHIKRFFTALCAFINPSVYPVCTFLGRHVQKELIDDAEYELSGDNYLQINSMYITSNYFIDLGKKNIAIIPLNNIVWCYRLGTMPFNLLHHNPEYSLYFTILDGRVITVRHKTSDEALELINAIRATGYDIIIGHSDSKRKLAKKICKNYKISCN